MGSIKEGYENLQVGNGNHTGGLQEVGVDRYVTGDSPISSSLYTVIMV